MKNDRYQIDYTSIPLDFYEKFLLNFITTNPEKALDDLNLSFRTFLYCLSYADQVCSNIERELYLDFRRAAIEILFVEGSIDEYDLFVKLEDLFSYLTKEYNLS